jgi:hypothetical protein
VARYRDGKFTQFLRAQGPPYEYAWALFGDADGSVWIGTPGAGLIRWREGRFDSFTTRQGLRSDFICSIQADPQGHLWLGSYAGILRVTKAELDQCAREEGGSVNCLDSDDMMGVFQQPFPFTKQTRTHFLLITSRWDNSSAPG